MTNTIMLFSNDEHYIHPKTYLMTLPCEIYKIIYQYVFSPCQEIRRYKIPKQIFTRLLINKCHVCNSHSSKTSLAHLCDCCDDYHEHTTSTNNYKYCDNQLICFHCAH
jgi:hypothetical protein